jgi:hypothetical protein
MTSLPQFQKLKTSKAHCLFTPEEDAFLRLGTQLYGTGNWDLIAEDMEGRTGRQCKERWVKYLAPGLSHLPWTPEEDALLLQKYSELGRSWAKIARFFPRRTDIMIKNRFHVVGRGVRKKALAPGDAPLVEADFPAPPQQAEIGSVGSADAWVSSGEDNGG